MKYFVTEGEWGTLFPDNSGLRMRIPSWVALIVFIPLMILFGFASLAQSLPLQLLFGVPGLLFFALWFMSRRISNKSGLVRVNRDAGVATFTGSNGSESCVQFGRFKSIQIERVNIPRASSWRAVLCGDKANMVLNVRVFRGGLIKWVSPVANWLEIPVNISSKEVGLEWVLTPNAKVNPYPATVKEPNNAN